MHDAAAALPLAGHALPPRGWDGERGAGAGHPDGDGGGRYGDAALFERLILEINQAGLSWTTILKKREGFHRAYRGFDIDAVAAFNEADRARLLADPAVIRNRKKVDAAIENARRLVALRERFGSFAGWLDQHHPRSKEAWVTLFRQTFVFTGGEIVNEFLVSTGYLPGAHSPECPVYAWIIAANPP
jgi:DNA-3-methyladenine glycosylase I